MSKEVGAGGRSDIFLDSGSTTSYSPFPLKLSSRNRSTTFFHKAAARVAFKSIPPNISFKMSSKATSLHTPAQTFLSKQLQPCMFAR